MNIEQKQVYYMLLVSVYNGVNIMVQTSSEVTARKSFFCVHHFSTLGSSLLKFMFFLDFFFFYRTTMAEAGETTGRLCC